MNLVENFDYHDLLGRFYNELNKIQFLQQTRKPIEWVDFLGLQYTFNPSPTTGISRHAFARPDNVTSLAETVRDIGRPPFIYKKGSGDWHITNEHFLRHLKNRKTNSRKYENVKCN